MRVLALHFNQCITHHLKLTLIALSDQLFVSLGLFDFLLKCLDVLLVLGFDFGCLIFPLVFFLENLKAGTLAQTVNLEELL
jgi:hypothetical protein